jgi:cyclopropane-fatty-acyl-phospholipid synthase
VFPDGALVPARTMIGHRERAGFEIQDVEQLRRHYARTLRHWGVPRTQEEAGCR